MISLWLLVCVLCLSIRGGLCIENTLDDNEDSYVQVYLVGGVLAMIGLVLLVMLCADEVQHTAEPPPNWTSVVQLDNSINTGFSGVSDGMRIVDPNTVQRVRKGDYEADGARWGAPLQTGKHIFEITWPKLTRSYLATVGVGTSDAPLFVKPKDSLVGCNRYSWGLDIARCKCLHRDKVVEDMPRNKIIPDTFFMYVDCESGTVGFGTQFVYWGAPLSIPKSEFPVYPMVGSTQHMSQISMKYKGTALSTVGDTGYNQVQPMPVLVPAPIPGPPPPQPPPPPYQEEEKKVEEKKAEEKKSDDDDESRTYIAPMTVSGI